MELKELLKFIEDALLNIENDKTEDILGFIDIEGDYEKSDKVDRVYKNPEIKPVKEIKNKRIKN